MSGSGPQSERGDLERTTSEVEIEREIGRLRGSR
jgi:hypothetical protein